jgi:fatty acid desaturase
MNERNQILRETFLFSASDLRANRAGQLSPRQQARQRAAGSSMRLAMAVFIFVMLATLGVLAFGAIRSGVASSLQDSLPTFLIVAAVVVLVILVGVLTSLRYMTAARVKQISIATGLAQVGTVREDASHFELKIGKTRLRLLTIEQLEAFQPGVAYRVHYLAGAVPFILSAEVEGSEAENDALAAVDISAPVEEDWVVRLQHRARPILYLLAILVVGIPLLGFAMADLSPGLQRAIWVVLLAVSIGFVFWAVRRISPQE